MEKGRRIGEKEDCRLFPYVRQQTSHDRLGGDEGGGDGVRDTNLNCQLLGSVPPAFFIHYCAHRRWHNATYIVGAQ